MPERREEKEMALDDTKATRREEGARGTPRTVTAGDLLGPSGLLRIDLEGEIYTLRLTRNHRLILTK